MSLYGWVMLGTIAGPLALSFDRKVAYYKSWPALFKASIPVALVFLVWDAFFTEWKIWGFNPDYLSGIYLYNLPIEEVLFFILVPFSCLFIHQVLKAWLPSWNNPRLGRIFAFALTLSAFSFGLLHLDNAYTGTACILAAMLTIGVYHVGKAPWYAQFAGTYLVAVIPFLVVNGILTGALTPEPIVWYSEEHIMGPRMLTIPVEDLFYNYDLLLPVTWLFEHFLRKKHTT